MLPMLVSNKTLTILVSTSNVSTPLSQSTLSVLAEATEP